jgi:hypothetical protein
VLQLRMRSIRLERIEGLGIVGPGRQGRRCDHAVGSGDARGLSRIVNPDLGDLAVHWSRVRRVALGCIGLHIVTT